MSETPFHSSPLRDGEASEVSDQELLQQVASQNEEAFTQLYRRFSAPLFSLVYQILGDPKDTEDTIQEAFVQIWKRAGSFDGGRGTAFSWVVTIARNRAIDRVRSRQRRGHALDIITDEVSLRSDADETQDVEQNEERALARAALNRLPKDQREALELAFFGGLTHPEVSNQLQLPLGTIKARIRRGLLTLKDLLKRS